MSLIKITGGILRGRTIRKVPLRVRPTPAKLRQSFFEILGDIENLTFIDLFAGSGAMGIESLSRGANPVIFVELERRNCKIIESNITSLGLEKKNWEVVCSEALKWLDNFSTESGAIVFASPPYIEKFLPKVLKNFEIFASKSVDNVILALQYPKRNLPEIFEISRPSRIHKMGDDAILFWYNE